MRTDSRNHLHRLLIFFHLNKPDDRIKRIVKKMWINLCLSESQLCFSQGNLLLTVLLDQLV